MKKLITLVLALVSVLLLVSCGKNDIHEIGITVSPDTIEVGDYQDEIDYSDEGISPTGDKITIYATQSLGDALIVLIPMEAKEEKEYQSTYITPGMPVEMDVEKGAWYKIGVAKYNDTGTEKTVYVQVEGVEVRSE